MFGPNKTPQVVACLASWIVVPMVCIVLAGCTSQQEGGQTKMSKVAKTSVVAQGLILPEGGIIQLAAAPGDIVAAVHVKPGQMVTAGTRLLTLRSEEVLTTQREALELRYQQATSGRERAIAAAKLQLAAAELQLERAKAARQSMVDSAVLLDVAEQQVAAGKEMTAKLKRIAANDVTREFVGQLEVEQQELKVGEAQLSQMTRADEHRRALSDAEFAIRAAQVDVQNAKLAVGAAQANQSLAVIEKEMDALAQKVAAAQVESPTGGKILSVRVSPGEATSAFPLVEMADISQLVCEVEINEQDAGLVEVGQKATLTSRAFAEPMTGQVEQKYALVGKPQLRQLDPLARVDYRTVTAVIKLDPASSERAKEWLQLQVKAEITIK